MAAATPPIVRDAELLYGKQAANWFYDERGHARLTNDELACKLERAAAKFGVRHLLAQAARIRRGQSYRRRYHVTMEWEER